MRDTNTHPSLLSYLLPEQSKFCLRLQPADHQLPSNNSSSLPFTLLDESDPLAHTFRGAFVTDFGSVIKEVNLLIQRDTPLWPAESKITLTNAVIDTFWQQASATRRSRNPEHSMMLASQIGKQQQLLAFTSLFYCRKQQTYFEPPCPECGKILQLCKDDSLLTAASLAPYSTSLRRYLFCPSCFQSGTQSFYTLEKSTEDPPTVCDCKQLMLKFESLTPALGEVNTLPCLGCQEHEHCYGSQQDVYDTLFTLSFYPFFLLLTECNALDGFHFLTLLHKNSTSTPSVATSHKKPPADSSDKAIHTIIQNLADNWRQETNNPPPPPPPREAFTSGDNSPGQETVIPEQKTSFSATLPEDFSNGDDDLHQETIIIKSPVPPPVGNHDALETNTGLATIDPVPNEQLQTMQAQGNTQALKNKPKTDDIDLAETIILRPGDKL